MSNLQLEIEQLFEEKPSHYTDAQRSQFLEFRELLNRGSIRSAEPDASHPTGWRVNTWVKKGILVGFRMGSTVEMSGQFFDKSTYPLRKISIEDGVRIIPGGSSIRDGCYIGRGVICVPPMYINVGSYVDDGTLVDSHALIGSCAQIGKNCHISAASQIGGVLEPVGAMPVIVEDDVLVGGNCGIYEGTIVKRRAVLGSGTILNRSTPVYDLVRETVHRAEGDAPLVIPEEAVVVAGARAIKSGVGKDWGISLYTPVIVKYRDAGTETKIQLEDLLR
ncbi:MAG TPA: 2,3,4,5-tetrahydropyridine-2,6-dicarboxylate N-succinyltransferase [Bryobacteraceae bacterium]|nr:2,3,4,5-tetrahydropyridine-2,6-dicarboxylate N-succinyltransferase [Bryobacteraceae bacterium]